MSTFIHGIASAQCLDKSGEMVEIKGLDITSLARSGTINWEHNMGKDPEGKPIQLNLPAQVVGKILKAKKIFSKDDCADAHELKFWNKAKVPFVYIVAELLDAYTASAKECAGQFKYSRDNPDLFPILGFSVEGSELPNSRRGMLIGRSIGRKVTLTVAPCNSMCVAEILENHKSKIKDDFEEIFKSEAQAIELFKSGEGTKIYTAFLAKKEMDHVLPVSSKAPKTFGQRPVNQGTKIGATASGKDVFSHGKVGEYGFNSGEHKQAGELHQKAALSAGNAKLADNHIERMKLHNQAALTSGRRESVVAKTEKTCELHKGITGHEKGVHLPIADKKRQGTSVMGTHVRKPTPGYSKEAAKIHSNVTLKEMKQIKPDLPKSEESGDLKKALTAGMPNAAPSTLVNGAAYQTEGLARTEAKTGAEDHNFQATKKKDWNKRAKSDYETWPHREKFERFMKARLPHLHEGEIRAIGRALALKKSMDFEKSLEGMISIEKAEPAPSKKNSFNPKIRQVAEQHMASKGQKLEHPGMSAKVNPDFASKLAQAYHQMKHDPMHPDVKRSYDALKKETGEQYNTLKNAGLKVSSIKAGQANPYKNSQDVFDDIHHNNHLWYQPTEGAFGSNAEQGQSDHPLLEPTTEMHEGKPMLANDMFRIVHDYFGHAKEGNGFGPNGEENAWQNHARMYTPEAKRAMTTETRGQNSWVNFGPHGEHNRANPSKTIYADQKAGLLPDWAHQLNPTEVKKS
jgi:hypothetical protein